MAVTPNGSLMAEAQVPTDLHYGRIADLYDTVAGLWSCGAIRNAKLAQMGRVAAGHKVLVAGPGCGVELSVALAAGADVTAVDISQHMLDNCRARVDKAGLGPEAGTLRCCCEDIMGHSIDGGYDVVIANFFLCCFSRETSPKFLDHLCRLVKPGGIMIIADYAFPVGLLATLLQPVYFGIGCLFFWLLAGNPMHLVYNYAEWMPADMALESRQDFGPFYETLVFRRWATASLTPDCLRRSFGPSTHSFFTSSGAKGGESTKHAMRHFLVGPEGAEIGYVAFIERVVMGARLRLVIDQPVCASERAEEVLDAFLANCDAVHEQPIFCQVSKDYEAPLARKGFAMNTPGVEWGLPLGEYTVKGSMLARCLGSTFWFW